MASIYFGGSLARKSQEFKSDWVTIASGSYTDVQCRATCNVSYNSTTRTYFVGPIYVYLRRTGTAASLSYVLECTYRYISSGSGSGPWHEYNFNSNRSVGDTISSTSITTSGMLAHTLSQSNVTVGNVYTDDFVDVKGSPQTTWSMKLYNSDGTLKTATGLITINLDFRFYGGQVRSYNVSYYENSDFGGGLISSASYQSGKTVSIRQKYNRSLSATTLSRGVSFNTLGGVPQPDYRDKSVTQSRKYIFDSWSGLQPGTTITVNGNKTYVEQYHIEYGNINWKTVGSLPSVNKKGYKRTNLWYDQNGGQVSGSTQVTESLVLHPEWEALTYNVRFDLAGGKLKEEDGRISEYMFSKTYGVGQKLPSIEPIKLGYSFGGWTNQAGTVTPQGPGATMDDRVYDSMYTDYTTGAVTLYAKWVLKPNTVVFDYWYNTQDSNPSHDIHITNESAQYNITQSIFEYGQPKLGYRTGDYVFLGWSDVTPDEYDKPEYVNSGYHGVYNIPPDIIKTSSGETSTIDLPLQINPADFKEYNKWGISDTYYGIWAKTGKYIKINNVFKKVSVAYVKIDGVWKKITGAWTKANNVWKKEV